MINKFLTKHNITIYRLSKLTGISQQTLHLWAKKGPPNPKFVEMALKQLDREIK